MAPWRSGYAEACKALYSGSNPDGASKNSSSSGGTVDTRDLKSLASWACGFDSRLEHHKKSSIPKGYSRFFIIARSAMD